AGETDYVLSNDTPTSPSLTIGVNPGEVADVILRGGGGRTVISSQATSIGRATLSTGRLTVTDELRLLGSGDLMVGESGTGTLTIENGAVVSSDEGLLGVNEALGFAGLGIVVVTGSGSNWNMQEGLDVGIEGAGRLTIEAGGSVSNIVGSIGLLTAGATGEVTVTGAGSRWTNSHLLQIGVFGSGTLTIAEGARVTNTSSNLAFNAGSSATVTVTGTGSQWINSENLDVGLRDVANVTIADGGSVTNVVGRIGINAEATGIVTVTDPGSTWENSGDLFVAEDGEATLNISNGGNVENLAGRIADQSDSMGVVTVTGADSTWTNNSSLQVGRIGEGELHIESGGRVTSRSSSIGLANVAIGEVTVTDEGSSWTNLSLIVGDSGRGGLVISEGGVVTSDTNGLVANSPGSVGNFTVRDPGSAWNIGNNLSVGVSGTAAFNVQNGAAITSNAGFIGREPGSSGFVIVTGAQSTWLLDERLSIGGNADTAANGGFATLSISLGGTVDVAQDTVLFPNGRLRLHEDGTLATTAIRFDGGGDFDWVAGTLHVDVFEDDLTIPSGGTLAPGRSAGSTTILGDYTQSAGATLEIEVGGTATATQFDFVEVTGTALLGGNLEVALVNGFEPDPDDEFIVFNADDLLSFFTNAGNGQRIDTVDGVGSFLVHYGPTSPFDPDQIVLSEFVLARVPGDYNQNGVVDAADYVVWRKADGIQAGFDLWRANFGRTAGNGAGASTGTATTVPEPASILLACVAAISMCTFCRLTRVEQR
ncbi:MAG TPA: hypothetical protein VHK01_03700, partial [Lacipirellulaceae bacterium]|nr:hypothetical protein [Lacipirellulaceae bacterium]